MAYPETYGSIAGYTVQANQRATKPGETGYSATTPSNVATVSLIKGAAVTEVYAGDGQGAAAAGRGIIAAFAAIGAQVTLGTPSAPITGANGIGPITRSVTLTPGTPLPPCRSVSVQNGGSATLILANGGTYSVGAFPGNTDRPDFNVSAVDATNVTPGTVIVFYY